MPPVLVYAAHPFLLEGEFFWSRAMTTVFEKTRRHPEFASSGKAFFHDPMILPAVGEVDVVDDFEHSAVGHDETSHMAIPPGGPNCPGGVAKNFMYLPDAEGQFLWFRPNYLRRKRLSDSPMGYSRTILDSSL